VDHLDAGGASGPGQAGDVADHPHLGPGLSQGREGGLGTDHPVLHLDGDEDGAAITEWLRNTQGIPGIVGAMYTTWEDKYEAMDVWASKAWGAKASATH